MSFIGNRAVRRALAKSMKGHSALAGFRGVILQDGPLGGRIVAPGAPVLHPEWWRSWNKAIEVGYARGEPVPAGRYVRDETAALATAVWRPLQGADR